MIFNKAVFLVFSITFFMPVFSFADEFDVSIRANNNIGQGVLRQYEDKWYVFTAEKLVRGALEIKIDTSEQKNLRGTYYASFHSGFAVIQVTENTRISCDNRYWETGQREDKAPDHTGNAFLIGKFPTESQNTSDARRWKLSVKICSHDGNYYNIKCTEDPHKCLDELFGSYLEIDGEIAGIYIGYKPNKIGSILCLDSMFREFDQFLSDSHGLDDVFTNEYLIECIAGKLQSGSIIKAEIWDYENLCDFNKASPEYMEIPFMRDQYKECLTFQKKFGHPLIIRVSLLPFSQLEYEKYGKIKILGFEIESLDHVMIIDGQGNIIKSHGLIYTQPNLPYLLLDEEMNIKFYNYNFNKQKNIHLFFKYNEPNEFYFVFSETTTAQTLKITSMIDTIVNVDNKPYFRSLHFK